MSRIEVDEMSSQFSKGVLVHSAVNGNVDLRSPPLR